MVFILSVSIEVRSQEKNKITDRRCNYESKDASRIVLPYYFAHAW
jgi:hypothetical protein